MVVITPARPSCAGGQEDAPGERVDRGASHQRVVAAVAVDGGQIGEVGHQHQHDRDLVEMLGKATRSLGGSLGDGRGLGQCLGCSRSRSVTAAHGVRPAPTWARYSYHPGR